MTSNRSMGGGIDGEICDYEDSCRNECISDWVQEKAEECVGFSKHTEPFEHMPYKGALKNSD